MNRLDSMRSPSDTVRDTHTQSVEAARRDRLARRIGIVITGVFVAAGLLGLLGYRQSSASATAPPFTLTVSYPSISRGGLPSNWQLRLTRTDGEALPPSIEIRSSAAFFDDFDENGLDPDPASTWVDADELVWTFEPPLGARSLTVSFDARLQPNARGWRDGSSTVVIEGLRPLTVDYRIWELP